jgi:hypothetical protein
VRWRSILGRTGIGVAGADECRKEEELRAEGRRSEGGASSRAEADEGPDEGREGSLSGGSVLEDGNAI